MIWFSLLFFCLLLQTIGPQANACSTNGPSQPEVLGDVLDLLLPVGDGPNVWLVLTHPRTKCSSNSSVRTRSCLNGLQFGEMINLLVGPLFDLAQNRSVV
ncbi:hypothetical protein Zmor_006172 [Zophobas morio]|uniref:Uncharacterized protein n=1 Tax=Zophobas morio TaxID=2755281 RepID=A0AA38IUD3_9CUCU|nr:hypothetical protein Zmor_006172 [Zophobas morio]